MRHRLTLKPDEAFGMIFSFEGVVADTRGVLRTAWEKLAAEKGLPLPPHVRTRLPMANTCPERVMLDVCIYTKFAYI
jgi:beta-phosphoglucomutase-like phosphatase (HAD superfamily)